MRKKSGYTLTEVTLIITLILGLIAVLGLSVKAYLKSSTRSSCIMRMSGLKKAMEGCMLADGYRPGDNIPNGSDGRQRSRIQYMYDKEPAISDWREHLSCTWNKRLYVGANENTFPESGFPFQCPNVEELNHVPKNNL